MKRKSTLVNEATEIAEAIFDNQMLEMLDLVKSLKGLHAQHRFILIIYIEANKKRLEDEKSQSEV